MPDKPRKRIVVGLDGSCANSLKGDYTGKDFTALTAADRKDYEAVKKALDGDPLQNAMDTNIYRILEALAPDSGDTSKIKQECQYFPGVATMPPLPNMPGVGIAARFACMSFGFENMQRIPQAYQWLCKAYDDKYINEITFIGFSRGAFATRAVAGIVNRHGLLRAADGNYSSEAFYKKCYNVMATYFMKNYKAAGSTDDFLGFKEHAVDDINSIGTFGTSYEISAVCCWETVGSMGIPLATWHRELLLPVFKPLMQLVNYLGPDPEKFLGLDQPATMEHVFDQYLPEKTKFAFHSLALNETMGAFRPSLWELKEGSTSKLEQVWFAGDHMDNGGGGQGGLKDPQVADITLAWMMSRLEDNGLLHFKPDYLPQQVQKHRATMTGKPQPWGLGATHRTIDKLCARAAEIGAIAIALVSLQARTPGWYHRLDLRGVKTGDYLAHTREAVHRSVRIRLAHPTDRGAEGYGDYAPLALKSWTKPGGEPPEVDDADDKKGTKEWLYYSGWSVSKRMAEPVLGSYEKVVRDAWNVK